MTRREPINRMIAALTIGVLSCMPDRTSIADDAPVTLEKIIDAWKAREQNTKSFDFHWSARRFEDGKTGLFAMSARRSAVRNRGAVGDRADIPELPDANFIVNYRYVTDGKGRIRVEESGQEWSTEKSDLVPRVRLEIFDGTSRNSFSLAGAIGSPRAYVGGPVDTIGKLVWLHPVNMVYRPLSKSGGVLDERSLAMKAETAEAGGQAMLVLTDGNRDVWVDPTRDFVPVRYSDGNGGSGFQMDLSFTRDQQCGWVPRLWTIKLLDSAGKPQISESAKVLEYSVNKAVENSEFDTDLDRELAKMK